MESVVVERDLADKDCHKTCTLYSPRSESSRT